jgi:transcriptional antiterminator RfaH
LNISYHHRFKEGGSSMKQAVAQWFAVYTKPRQERIAREHLARQGFECFLPLAVNPYQRRSRLRTLRIEPLFPRYLFLHATLTQDNLAPVRSTRGVVNMVRAGTQLLEVPKQVIQSLHARMNAETGLIRIEPVAVQAGDRVRVFDGPLAGLEGLFQLESGKQRALLLVELMGRQTTVEVDRLMLQKAV